MNTETATATTSEQQAPPMPRMSVLSMEKFKNTVMVSITIRRFGNSKRISDTKALAAYLEQLKVETATATPEERKDSAPAAVFIATDSVKSTKTLIRSKNLDRLCRAMNALKSAAQSMAMPSFIKPGILIVKEKQFPELERVLSEGWEEIQRNELLDFIKDYPLDIENARTLPVRKGGLGPLWNQADYAPADEIAKTFRVEWFPIALSVPENIPDELKAKAQEDFKRRMTDAAEQIEQALREQLLELVTHAEERLTVTPGEKPKVFRESLIANLVQFLNTFESRDIFGDERLAGIVTKAREIMLDAQGNAKLDTKKLREMANVRDAVRQQFANIKKELAGMVEEQGRVLDLSED